MLSLRPTPPPKFVETHISPTQVESFDRCNRLWWFKWGWENKLYEPESEAQYFGTVVHSIIERYLKGDRLQREGNLYPEGWDKGLSLTEAELIKQLISKAIEDGVLVRLPNMLIEEPVLREIYEAPGIRVSLNCKIDVLWEGGVQDHKTTKNMKYALSADKLRKSPQMLIYVMEFLQRLKEQDKPFPEQIEIRHNVFCKDPEKKIVRKTAAYVTPQEAFDYWGELMERVLPTMLSMKQKVTSWEQIPWPENRGMACNAYGGCKMRGICYKTETVEMYRRRNPKKILHTEVKTETKKEPQVMALIDRLKNKGPSGTPPSMPAASPFDAAAPIVAPKLAIKPPTAAQAQAAKALPSSVAPPPMPVLQSPAPPWACNACKACNATGFNTKGNPCRSCDVMRKQVNGITSADFNITTDGKGNISWVPIPDRIELALKNNHVLVAGGSFVPNLSQEPVQVVEAAPQTEIVDDDPLGIDDDPDQLPDTTMFDDAASTSPPIQMPPVEEKRGPGRPRKGEEKLKVPSAVRVSGVGTAIPKSSFVLMLGCYPRNPKSPVTYIEAIISEIGAEIASANQLKNYYEGEVWRRRDALAACAQEIAIKLNGQILVVPSRTTDNETLVDALIPRALEVFEGYAYRAKTA